MRNFFLLTALLIGSVAASSSASAATVNFNLGTLNVGSFGTDSILTPNTSYVADKAFGYIPSHSEITFSYTLAPALPSLSFGPLGTSANLYAFGSYNYELKDHEYYGTSEVTTPAAPVSHGFTNTNDHTVASQPLVLASANITSPTTGITTIVNNSSKAAYFLSILQGQLKGISSFSFSVSSVSQVPLPASLPLFALALAGVVAFGYRNKLRSNA